MKRELYFAKLAGKNHLRGFLWRAIDMIDSLSPLTWQKKMSGCAGGCGGKHVGIDLGYGL